MYVFGFFAVCMTPFYSAQAAQVYLDGGEGTYGNTDTFYIPVRVDTQGECINAVKVVLGYNPDVLSIKDVSTAGSVLSLWTQHPTIERVNGVEVGRIVFEGGIPGGYCGRVIGDPGMTNVLARLVATGATQLVAVDEPVTTQIVVEPQTVTYLHDGGGSPAELSVLGVELVIVNATSTPRNEWLSDIKEDTIAPELFEIYFVEGPSVGNQRHYVVFNTTDKQSGIDHYEVLETDPDRFGFLSWLPKESHWVQAESPYVLRDQKLHSKIMVKAVDKNGNERVVTFTPPMTPFEGIARSLVPMAVLMTVLLLLVLAVYLIRRRWVREHMQHEHDDDQRTVPYE